MLLTGFRNIEEDEMDKIVRVNNDEYEIVRLLGHGKGGYSYLALSIGKEVVLKQIHSSVIQHSIYLPGTR